MANKDNLKPVRSTEEARRRGKSGGIASGVARRRKRDAKSAAKLILDLPTNAAGIKKNLESLGLTEEDFTNRVALMGRAFTLAMSGDINAMKFLVDCAGENPKQKLEEKKFKAENVHKNITANDSTDEIENHGKVTIYIPDNGRDEKDE